MEERLNGLDDTARLATELALATARGLGDSRCGTEYLLYGIVASAKGELMELMDLFALDTLRVERAIHFLRAERLAELMVTEEDPPLSPRAREALRTPRADGDGLTGPFEVLHGALADDESGACRVLRELGVRPEEMRRLVRYGTRHLSREQIDDLIRALDRRVQEHRPWWGPIGEIENLQLADGGGLEVARSRSAVVTIRAVGVDANGFGLTIGIESLADWVLPPVLEPTELLIPGREPQYPETGPDFFRLQMVFSDGSAIDNRRVGPRFVTTPPSAAVLVPLGQRVEIDRVNDRRTPEHRVVRADWWVWPLPPPGTVEVRVDWPAESISGLASFDGRPLLETARGQG